MPTTDPGEPIPDGTPIAYTGQMWSLSHPGGIGHIAGPPIPARDGTLTYPVITVRDLACGRGPRNPMDQPRTWPADVIRPAATRR